MRLILRYEISDGYTYSATVTLPVEYDSAEALIVDFMDAARKAFVACEPFKFLGEEFSLSSIFTYVDADYRKGRPDFPYARRDGSWFLETAPDILTLDEFFADALRQKGAAKVSA